MIIVAVLLSLFAHLVVLASQPWQALDPEQALYVYKRCYEDHLPKGPEKKTYLAAWNAWKMEPNDNTTHCYAKCVLTGLQIYDEKENAFKSDRIPVQYQEYKDLIQATEGEVSQYQQKLAAADPKQGRCVDLYNAYFPVHNQFVNLSRQLYHGTVEGAAKIYAARPDIKQKGESFHAYCEKRAWKNGKQSEWKQGRSYELTGSQELKDAINCIFHGLRYMDDSGLKVDEIVRDFDLTNKKELGPKVREVLAKCKGSEAYDYYSCLVNSEIKEDFKNAFDFHELRSADYAYLLRGKVYESPAQVKEEMKKLNTTVHF